MTSIVSGAASGTLTNTIAMAVGSSWVSGINLYAAVATLGLLGKYAHIPLPGDLSFVTSWWVLGTALCLYCVEFLADKIPYLDTAWDAVHTFIRVPAGAVLAAAAFANFDPAIRGVALLLGGSLALSSHGTKAATRAAINTSPEPVTNAVASVGEDVLAVGSISLAAFYPIILLVLAASGVIVSFIVIPKTIRYFRTMKNSMRDVRDKLFLR